jgi:hypothetical protein
MKIATIRLQWNPKPKMMPPAKVVLPTLAGSRNSVEAATPAKTQKGIIENVRHVET